ncbi:hypothetical protein GSI_03160 [Ganoderma sinense ZZ0214-1]|uniref:Reverse transcriptase domain-containing protein n=1 Tax=Ganoderma sinense ZZ0214-1 TaxID=1077348 RepID=A0A2G8SKU1_9APHY|nr:hypothetical protein GSI_03160 [Ganoderma sinense ZZ0214-1]
MQVRAAARGFSDHALLDVELETPPWCFLGEPTIGKGSEEEDLLLAELTQTLPTLLPSEAYPPDNWLDIHSIPSDAATTTTSIQLLYQAYQTAWTTHAEPKRFCSKSASWWSSDLTDKSKALRTATRKATPPWQRKDARRKYSRRQRHHPDFLQQHPTWSPTPSTRSRTEKRAELRQAIRRARNKHMETRIREISEEVGRVWDLGKWTHPRRSSMATDLIHDGQTLTDPESLWPAFNQTFHAATHRPVDHSILEDIEQLTPRDWPPFSSQELKDAIKNTTTSSAPGVDHIHWRHLKFFIDPKKNPKTADKILQGFRTLFNACIQYNVWPEEFRRAVTVIIPKPNKPDYSKIKAYRPIVLLSCTAKWLEKVINNRLQYDLHKHGILHPCQFGSAWQKSTVDAVNFLQTHIRGGWHEGLVTTMLGFDIAQFFPSVNHGLLVNILRRYGFSPTFCTFIATYFSPRKSSFRFRNSTSPDFECPDVGVGQGSSLSPTFSAVYLAPVLHAMHGTSTIQSQFALQFYVDDGNLVATSDSTERL